MLHSRGLINGIVFDGKAYVQFSLHGYDRYKLRIRPAMFGYPIADLPQLINFRLVRHNTVFALFITNALDKEGISH